MLLPTSGAGHTNCPPPPHISHFSLQFEVSITCVSPNYTDHSPFPVLLPCSFFKGNSIQPVSIQFPNLQFYTILLPSTSKGPHFQTSLRLHIYLHRSHTIKKIPYSPRPTTQLRVDAHQVRAQPAPQGHPELLPAPHQAAAEHLCKISHLPGQSLLSHPLNKEMLPEIEMELLVFLLQFNVQVN